MALVRTARPESRPPRQPAAVPVPIVLVALIAVAIAMAACGADTSADDRGTPLPSAGASDGPRLVIADAGGAPGAGISVADALGHGPTDDLVAVTGSLFVDADGTVRLCDAIAESFPPQCSGARLLVDGLDLESIESLQTEDDVGWAEAVTLFGSVE
jgi:hypothetical protein